MCAFFLWLACHRSSAEWAAVNQCLSLMLSRGLNKTDIAEVYPCSIHVQTATSLLRRVVLGFYWGRNISTLNVWFASFPNSLPFLKYWAEFSAQFKNAISVIVWRPTGEALNKSYWVCKVKSIFYNSFLLFCDAVGDGKALKPTLWIIPSILCYRNSNIIFKCVTMLLEPSVI